MNIPQRSAALLKCSIWELHDLSCRQAACVRPWNIHFDLFQGVIVERSGNHSYKESASGKFQGGLNHRGGTKEQGNKVRQASKEGITYLSSGWGYMAWESLVVYDLTLGYKWPLNFWRCLSTKRRKSVSPITLRKDLADETRGVLLKRTWGEGWSQLSVSFVPHKIGHSETFMDFIQHWVFERNFSIAFVCS